MSYRDYLVDLLDEAVHERLNQLVNSEYTQLSLLKEELRDSEREVVYLKELYNKLRLENRELELEIRALRAGTVKLRDFVTEGQLQAARVAESTDLIKQILTGPNNEQHEIGSSGEEAGSNAAGNVPGTE